MPDRAPGGLFCHANRWSWVGLIAAPSLGIIMFVANLAYYAGDPHGDLILRPLHSQIAVALGTLGVCSVVVQIGCRLIRNQRRLIRLLEEHVAACREQHVNGVSDPKVLDIGARIASKITS